MNEDKAIPEGSVFICLHCNSVGILIHDMTISPGAVEQIMCAGCGELTVIKYRDPLAKVDPTLKRTTSFASPYHLGLTSGDDFSKEGEETADKPDTFQKMIDDASDHIEQARGKLDKIKDVISKIGDQVVSELKSVELIGDLISKNWKYGFIQEFVDRPFIAIPDTYNKDSFYLISPKFFQAPYGFKLPCGGGFNLQYVCPYSRLSQYALSELQCKLLRFEESSMVNLDLSVVGRKIIGSDILHLWRSIPGIDLDEDHTESMPSIRIHENFKARSWLALNSVQPWQERQFDNSFIDDRTIMSGLSSDIFGDVFKMFRASSRLLVNWDRNLEGAVNLCKFLLVKVLGSKLVISNVPKFNIKARGSEELIDLETYDKQFERIVASTDSISLVIVDTTDMTLKQLRKLYSFYGNLILINRSDDMCLNDREKLLTLHTLVSSAYVKEDVNWGEGWMSPVKLNDLHKTIKSLGATTR